MGCASSSPAAAATAGDTPVVDLEIVLSPAEDEELRSALCSTQAPQNYVYMALGKVAILMMRAQAAKMRSGRVLRPSRTGLPPGIANASVRRASHCEMPTDLAPTRQASRRHVRNGVDLLAQRLSFAGLQQVVMSGDGNCQYRALSYQLFETQKHHLHVRCCVCRHIADRKDEFGVYFEPGELGVSQRGT